MHHVHVHKYNNILDISFVLLYSLVHCLHRIRVAVFFFVFPISRSAHLWAPDEVKKIFFFAKQSRRPTHFHPAQQKKTIISISDRK